MEEELVFIVSHLSRGHTVVRVVVARMEEEEEIGGGAVEDAIDHTRYVIAHLAERK